MPAINPQKPLHVRYIRLADGMTLKDRVAFVAGGFLIVESDKEEQPPTWYNLSEVLRLQEVTIEEAQKKPEMRIAVF